MLGLRSSGPVLGQAQDMVDCSASTAFHVVAKCFFQNYPTWCPQVVELEELTPPPIRVGTKGRQVTRDRGIDSESTFDVTKFSPDTDFEITGSSEPFRSSYTFEKHDKGTVISFAFELKEIDLVMRPFQKLIRTALQDGAAQTIENIKNLIEGGRS
jgi:Polyketide cyclase / dehydrase and lipid transport